MAELKRTDVDETSRDAFSVLASMLVAGACAAAFGCSTPHCMALLSFQFRLVDNYCASEIWFKG